MFSAVVTRYALHPCRPCTKGIILPGRSSVTNFGEPPSRRSSQRKYSFPRTRVTEPLRAAYSVARGDVEYHHAHHDQHYPEDVHRPKGLLPDQHPSSTEPTVPSPDHMA